MSITPLQRFTGLFIALAAVAHFAAPQVSAQARSPSLQPSEARFLQGLYQDVIANQRMAEMAANRGRNQAVRQLGTNVGRDLRHSREDIKLLARQKRVSLSSKLTASNRQAVTRVSNAPARSFDRTYVETLQQQVARILQTSQAMATSTRDAELRAFLNQSIPRLERVNAEATTARARL